MRLTEARRCGTSAVGRGSILLRIPPLLDPSTLPEITQKTNRGPAESRMIRWIRYRHKIPSPELKRPEEQTVQEVAERFRVSPGVVYYWIERSVIPARRKNRGSPYWITLDRRKERELEAWVENSSRINHSPNP